VGAAVHNPVMWGVVAGLLIGKPVGVILASWGSIKTGLASMPESATVRQIVGVGVLCGIGFTMSLFVSNLAFPGSDGELTASKLGILTASVLAALAGMGILFTAEPQRGR